MLALAQGRTSGLAEEMRRDAVQMKLWHSLREVNKRCPPGWNISMYTVYTIYTNVINRHDYEPFFGWSWSLALNISRSTVSSVPPMGITWKPDEAQDIHRPAGWKYREHASHKVMASCLQFWNPHIQFFIMYSCAFIAKPIKRCRKVINLQILVY